jgi:hypothetical protein
MKTNVIDSRNVNFVRDCLGLNIKRHLVMMMMVVMVMMEDFGEYPCFSHHR